MNDHNTDRADLLRAAGAGDDDALGDLIEGYRPLLRATAHRSLKGGVRTRFAPSDVVNLTWWSAFRGFPGFQGDISAFEAWLQKIHDRNIAEIIRNQLAARRDVGREQPFGSHDVPGSTGSSVSGQRLVVKDLGEVLQRAMLRLPSAQREAVRLRFYEGVSMGQISEQMGRSEQSVAGLIKRGVAKLREQLKGRADV
ncbi:MAG: sigma-70 family RNA polymerase sigma factor [Planctomycetaceae bacterium]|nr:sigma-70 family RNA polymerase sigma factor [Planctomycetaceae bacterium]